MLVPRKLETTLVVPKTTKYLYQNISPRTIIFLNWISNQPYGTHTFVQTDLHESGKQETSAQTVNALSAVVCNAEGTVELDS